MAEVIARHHELAAEIAEAHGGRMPRSQGEGDSTLSAFARATDAAAAAVAFQRALAEEEFPEGIRLSVRAGMHTGEAQQDKGDYYGAAVSRAARDPRARAGRPGVRVACHGRADRRPAPRRRHACTTSAASHSRAWRAKSRSPSCASPTSTMPALDHRRPPDEELDDRARRRHRAFRRRVPVDARDRRAVRRSRGGAVDAALVVGAGERDRPPARRAARRRRGHGQDPPRRSSSRAPCTTRARRCWPGAATRRTSSPTSRSSKRSGGTSAPRRPPRCAPTSCAPARSSPGSCPTWRGDFPDLPEPVQAEPDTQRYLMFEAVNDLLGTLACLGAGAARARRPALGRPARRSRCCPISRAAGIRRALLSSARSAADEVADDHPLARVDRRVAARPRGRGARACPASTRTTSGGSASVACAFAPDPEFVRSMRPRDRGQSVLRPGDLQPRRTRSVPRTRAAVHARDARRARGREAGDRAAGRAPARGRRRARSARRRSSGASSTSTSSSRSRATTRTTCSTCSTRPWRRVSSRRRARQAATRSCTR